MRMKSGLSYANVMATIAVFIALGGGAYAALALPKNSVGAKQIKKNAVNSSKVKNGSLVAKDFKKGQLPAGATGPKGDAGAPGVKGDAGTPGQAGPPGPTVSRSSSVNQVPLIDDNPTETTVLTIESNQIVTTMQSRIMASANLDIAPNGGSAHGETTCHLKISDGSGPSNGLTKMDSQFGSSASYPDADSYEVTFPLNGSAVKPAGTYNVIVACTTAAGTPAQSRGGTLNVWAAGV